MTIWFVISFILLLIIGVIFIMLGLLQSEAEVSIFSIAFGAALIFYVAAFMCFAKPDPSAIDVYRGKTTLQITYQDSIPVDSVVVFKDKEK